MFCILALIIVRIIPFFGLSSLTGKRPSTEEQHQGTTPKKEKISAETTSRSGNGVFERWRSVPLSRCRTFLPAYCLRSTSISTKCIAGVVVDTKLIFTNAYINRIDSSNRDEFDSDSDDVPNRWQESMGSFYRMSALGRCLRKTNAAEDDEFFLPGGYHLVGDCTYPLFTRLMVPFGQSGNDDSKIKYDKYLHKARCHVDQALGKLIARFPRI
ncbi:unnamed protein product, partial [Nesidiocoris tenuis]